MTAGRFRAAVYMDFDETYLAHNMTPVRRRDLRELENYMSDESIADVLFAWVTGSSLSRVEQRLAQVGGSLAPKVVASSLGSDLRVTREGRLQPDKRWEARVNAERVSSSSIADLVREVAHFGICLQPQSDTSHLRASFYFAGSGEHAVDRRSCDRIVAAARKVRIAAFVAPCNPMAGDPEGMYDVDLVPLCAGKANVVRYVANAFGIPLENSFAFGDSVADLEMLRLVGNGYLVRNATAEASRLHSVSTQRDYARGILDTLLEHVSSIPGAAGGDQEVGGCESE
jgi:kanosamine-6-phosphate phosphatase